MRNFLSGFFALVSISGFFVLFGGFFDWKLITDIPIVGEHTGTSALLITFLFGWLSKISDSKL